MSAAEAEKRLRQLECELRTEFNVRKRALNARILELEKEVKSLKESNKVAQ